MHRCPRVILANRNISRVAPFFMSWVNSGFQEYPDGRGRYYQPLVLLEAFEILLSVRNREKELIIKKSERQ